MVETDVKKVRNPKILASIPSLPRTDSLRELLPKRGELGGTGHRSSTYSQRPI